MVLNRIGDFEEYPSFSPVQTSMVRSVELWGRDGMELSGTSYGRGQRSLLSSDANNSRT